ncbi:hypothetical protein [Maribacter dokdonensis]|uniref:hypothetical protein n=1 Tax=Maribacter dokdonensis TaxID=320912 RepID=UPI0027364B87|nr:hypothetical protein [Maribacter dokdonensis]MDP2526593.1 hypothetical protein [Maribacter dokdonensis]
MINQEIKNFCENWIEKTKAYSNDNLQDVFDKFFTLFVVYNRLYVEATFRMSNKGQINIQNRNSFPDPQAAKNYVIQYLNSNAIDDAFNADENCLHAIERLKDIIRNHEFNIKLNMVTGNPERDKDLELLSKMEANHTDRKIKAIADFIYSIRCNVFHAQKGYVQNQINVLNPVNTILIKLIELLFDKLKNE